MCSSISLLTFLVSGSVCDRVSTINSTWYYAYARGLFFFFKCRAAFLMSLPPYFLNVCAYMRSVPLRERGRDPMSACVCKIEGGHSLCVYGCMRCSSKRVKNVVCYRDDVQSLEPCRVKGVTCVHLCEFCVL